MLKRARERVIIRCFSVRKGAGHACGNEGRRENGALNRLLRHGTVMPENGGPSRKRTKEELEF